MFLRKTDIDPQTTRGHSPEIPQYEQSPPWKSAIWEVKPCCPTEHPSTAKMTATDSSETLINFYQATRRQIPRVSHFHSYCRENLGSRTINTVLVYICSSTTLSGRQCNVEWPKEDELKRMLMAEAMIEFKLLFQHNTGRGRYSYSIRTGRYRLRKLARKIPLSKPHDLRSSVKLTVHIYFFADWKFFVRCNSVSNASIHYTKNK